MVYRVFFDDSSCLLWIVDSFFFPTSFLSDVTGKKKNRECLQRAFNVKADGERENYLMQTPPAWSLLIVHSVWHAVCNRTGIGEGSLESG
jgi:hypothetical protein